MTYVVTSRCDGCKYTDCVEECPVDAFREGPTMLYIDPDACIDCNKCTSACPVEAIFPESELPERFASWKEINAREALKFPEITVKKSPLPTAKTIDQILEEEKNQSGGS